jgi:activator of HSP90 ATPase
VINQRITRRGFAGRLATLIPTLGIAGASFSSAATFACGSDDASGDGVSHAADAIHQEIVFKSSRQRVYTALTDAKQFDKVVDLSGVRQSGMLPPEADKPTQISREVGGVFALFGGYITGRHLELVANERIVQAWRAASWGPGAYSIAKFVLAEQGPVTKVVFDHTGFPKGAGKVLAAGWHKHYWEPLAKFLA